MKPQEKVLALAAPLPYTLYAWKYHRMYICQLLRRHRIMFLMGIAAFVLHVLRGGKRVAVQ